MANFLRNLLLGKPDQKDFTTADLPENRIQLFKQVLGVRKGNMLALNVLYLLIWLPAVFWTFLNGTQLLVGNVPTPEELQQILFTWLLILWPLIAITGPFSVGLTRVMCRWARDEHSFPYADFRAGIKENWKQALMFGALDGLVPLLLFICARFYMDLARQSGLFLLPLAILFAAAALWSLAAPIVPALIVSYRLNFRGILRNAFLMTLGQLPRAVAIRLLTLAAPILLALVASVIPGALGGFTGVVMALYAVFLLAFNRLVWASFANFLGEKYLNPKIEGARTNIGLRPKDEP